MMLSEGRPGVDNVFQLKDGRPQPCARTLASLPYAQPALLEIPPVG